MLGELICVLAAGVTTALAYLSGRIVFDAKRNSLRRALAEALAETMEWLGAFVIFLTANVGLGIVLIVATRFLTSRFVSLYAVDNLVLILLSAFQGLVFRVWWRLN